MSYENNCRGSGDRNPDFGVVERNGEEIRVYACRECGKTFDVDLVRFGRMDSRIRGTLLPAVPHHKPRKE